MKHLLTGLMMAGSLLLNAQDSTQNNSMTITDGDGATTISIGGETISISHNEMYEHHMSQGFEMAEEGDYEGAISQFKAAWLYDQGDAYLYYNLGLCSYYIQNYDDALNYFNSALEIEPGYEDVLSQRGITKSQLGDTYGAVADFKALLPICSDSARAYYNLGIVYLQGGNLNDACEQLGISEALGYPNAAGARAKYCSDDDAGKEDSDL